jgi:polyferredoxin
VYLGRELGLVEVAKAFAFPFLAINLAIIVVSRFLGRYLCGFVCPYGSVSRLAEWLRFRGKSRAQRASGWIALIGVCTLLAAVALGFWVDWRVFRDGSPLARTIAAAALVATSASFVAMVRGIGLDFCRRWCPSGVYFALLGDQSRTGVEFANPSACTECKACDKTCPMDLRPRDLFTREHGTGAGFYPEHASDIALCIRCGDCVNVCEATTARSSDPTPLRLGFLREPRRGCEPAPKVE